VDWKQLDKELLATLQYHSACCEYLLAARHAIKQRDSAALERAASKLMDAELEYNRLNISPLPYSTPAWAAAVN